MNWKSIEFNDRHKKDLIYLNRIFGKIDGKKEGLKEKRQLSSSKDNCTE